MSVDLSWLKALAPGIATAIAGPLGGLAMSFIADKLGVQEKTIDAVNKALTGATMSPDQITQIKLAEIDFQKFLRENEIDLEKIHADDRSSARNMQISVRSWLPDLLAIVVTIGFFGILMYMLTDSYSPTEPLLIMLGVLGTAWTSIIAFYYGSSSGSKSKNELIDKLASK